MERVVRRAGSWLPHSVLPELALHRVGVDAVPLKADGCAVQDSDFNVSGCSPGICNVLGQRAGYAGTVGPRTPSSPRLFSAAHTLYPALDPEGRGSVSSIRLCWEEWGKAQNKRVAAQVGEQGFATLRCRIVSVCPPLHSPPFPALRHVPGSCPSCTKSAGLPCSQVPGWVCPIGGANRRSWGRRRSYAPCRLFVGLTADSIAFFCPRPWLLWVALDGMVTLPPASPSRLRVSP